MLNEWYNFKTQENEALSGPPLDFTDYIPQAPAALSLYQLYVQDMGCTPMEAAVKILEAYGRAAEKRDK